MLTGACLSSPLGFLAEPFPDPAPAPVVVAVSVLLDPEIVTVTAPPVAAPVLRVAVAHLCWCWFPGWLARLLGQRARLRVSFFLFLTLFPLFCVCEFLFLLGQSFEVGGAIPFC